MAIQNSLHLVQHPKSFGIIGISVLKSWRKTLWDLLGRMIQAVQSAEQSQQIQSGNFHARPQAVRNFQR